MAANVHLERKRGKAAGLIPSASLDVRAPAGVKINRRATESTVGSYLPKIPAAET